MILWSSVPQLHAAHRLRVCSISWLEVVKAIPNQGVVCFVTSDGFFCFSFVFTVSGVCVVLFRCLCLSLPVQSTACKDSSVKWPIMCLAERSTLHTHCTVTEFQLMLLQCDFRFDLLFSFSFSVALVFILFRFSFANYFLVLVLF